MFPRGFKHDIMWQNLQRVSSRNLFMCVCEGLSLAPFFPLPLFSHPSLSFVAAEVFFEVFFFFFFPQQNVDSQFPSASDRKHAEMKRTASFGSHYYNRTWSGGITTSFISLFGTHTLPHTLRIYLNIDHSLGTFTLINPFLIFARECDLAGFALFKIYQENMFD